MNDTVKKSYAEKAIHGTSEFPVGIYDEHFAGQSRMIIFPHYHDEFELLMLTEGEAAVKAGDEVAELKKGDAVFICGGKLHSLIKQTEFCGFFAIVFSPQIVASESDGIYSRFIMPAVDGRIELPLKPDEKILYLIEEARNKYRESDPLSRLYIKSNILRIMAMLLENKTACEEKVPGNRMKTVKEAIEIIRKNYRYKLTLDDISEKLHISREHLCRIFRQSTGMPVMEYVMRLRVMSGAEKLLSEENSISDIAFECGFDSVSYFDKIFSRYMHCTPGEYRKRQKR